MTSLQDLHQKIKAMEQKSEAIDKKTEDYIALGQETKTYIDLLKQVEAMVKKGIEDPLEQTGSTIHNIKKQPGKTNVQVYEEILYLHGRPMHLTDILESALRMGVQFKNNGNPRSQLRNALNGAKKRFENTGNNNWWIRGRPMPEEQNHEDAV